MKNKILSYLLGGLFVLSMSCLVGNVYADDGDDWWYYAETAGYLPQDGGCGDIPEGFVCCSESLVSAEIGCDGAVVTPEKQECKDGCCGIKLNTNFPGIGNCIPYDRDGRNPTTVFPRMMGTLTKLIMSIIFVVCFIMIIIAGVMRAGAGEDSSQKTKAKNLIKKVAITILLLGFSGAILRLINPNFFG